MMRKTVIPSSLILLIVLSILLFYEAGNEELPGGILNTDAGEYHYEILADQLEAPWEIVLLSDGEVLVTERVGRVLLIRDGMMETVYEIEDVGEAGLLGMALDPDFEENSSVYLYYAYEETLNRVSRFTFTDGKFIDEEVIIDGIPGHRFHSGGRLTFGHDGKLYVTTGDADEPELSQDLESLAGKVLRVNSDGSLPAENPFENSPVYAYGIRNAQGLAVHPETGEIFISDHGPTRQDEINLIKPGKNYGWPLVSCGEGPTEFEDPILCYEDFTLAPSGMDFSPGKTDGNESTYDEVHLYVAGLRSQMVKRITFDSGGEVTGEHEIFSNWGRIRSVTFHEGSLYLSTSNRDGLGAPGEQDDLLIRVTPKN